MSAQSVRALSRGTLTSDGDGVLHARPLGLGVQKVASVFRGGAKLILWHHQDVLKS